MKSNIRYIGNNCCILDDDDNDNDDETVLEVGVEVSFGGVFVPI